MLPTVSGDTIRNGYHGTTLLSALRFLLENFKRYSDFGQTLGPQGTKEYSTIFCLAAYVLYIFVADLG